MKSERVLLEIRPGTGGTEAALFGAELLAAYLRFAARRGLRADITEHLADANGALKKAGVVIAGAGAGALAAEAGVHRVQRIPKTETRGRLHTSAVSVSVLPVCAPESAPNLPASELRVETFRASGAGGQHVNKTDSAVRMTHLPTGLVASCQNSRSQHQNREQAMQLLVSRLQSARQDAQQTSNAELRKSHIGSGDRSEKIRTYHFGRGLVTDHRLSGKASKCALPKILPEGHFEVFH